MNFTAFFLSLSERRERPLRFDEFMEMALYCPGLGYYTKAGGPPAIGREGDFYTSVSVGPLFGRLLARQFLQMWERLGKPEPFWIVEQGAHDGQLSRDILGWIAAEAPNLARVTQYGIVDGPSVEGTGALDIYKLSLERPTGVFFSNELVDAFPVRVVTRRGGEWLERHVIVKDGKLAWLDRPIADHPTDENKLSDALTALNLPEIEGYTTEINLRARTWMTDVAHALRRGYVLTIDYGLRASDYYAAHRTAGTLTAYAAHKRVDDALADAGAQDITAHVDFTALARAGEEAGLTTLALIDQARFLTGIAHDELTESPGLRAGVAENTRAFQTLTHPQHLGAKFFALLQAKDAPANLDGLRFARASELP